ncbi:alpha/beta hydrolase [soil metagenome]
MKLLGRMFGLACATLCIVGPGSGAEAQQRLRPRDVDALPSTAPTATEHYGAGPLQFGELRMPAGKGPFPVAVVIHGGCWTQGFATLKNTAALASALAAKGIATWNIEYRQQGDAGGGWPGTYRDWGAATDHLRELGKRFPIDLSKVVVTGHSAGGHAALWVASRSRLPKGSEIGVNDPLPVAVAIALDGPGDLSEAIGFNDEYCGMPVVVPFMGGTPVERPERYAQGSPRELLPIGVPQVLVVAKFLLPERADRYAARARQTGDKVDVLTFDTGHFEVIAPGTDAGKAVLALIIEQAFASR